MKKQELINVLKKLEQNKKCVSGYNVKEILFVLNISYNREVGKQTRDKLRSLISKQLYPEFATAGDEDIVYCPSGKGSGKYRLSEFRNS